MENPGLLADRFRKTGVLALLLSPFLMVFAISYLFLQNAEVICIAPQIPALPSAPLVTPLCLRARS